MSLFSLKLACMCACNQSLFTQSRCIMFIRNTLGILSVVGVVNYLSLVTGMYNINSHCQLTSTGSVSILALYTWQKSPAILIF